MFAVNIDGSNYLQLIRRAKNRDRWPLVWNAQVQDRVISWLVDEPEQVLVQLNRDDPNRPSVFRLNIYNNSLLRIHRPRGLVRRWFATHEGNVRIAIGYKDDSIPIVYGVNGRKLTQFTGPAYASDLPAQPVGFSSDESQVYMSMTNGEDRHGIYRVDIATGEVLDTVYRDPEFDVFGGVIMHPETGEPVGVRYVGHHPKLVWFDERLEAIFNALRDRMPGREMRLISNDNAYNLFVLQSYGGVAPRYYLYDRLADELRLIGHDFEELADQYVADLKPVRYPSRDGLMVPAYLAVPEGPGPHPTVLLPHGGPYSRDSAEFDSWVQYIVDHGIAVLKPNYRGSVGYGEAYMQAGYKQWGLKMQEDLMDGRDWLVDQGVTDPDKICVVGASYGGYTALVSAYKFADKITCAVSLAGISDLEDTVERIYSFDLVKRNRERIQASADLKENSPIRQVEKIQVPILLLHGDRDTVVRVKQSRQFAAALEKNGKDFRYVEMSEGDHFLSGTAQREEFFVEMRDFLAKHLLEEELTDFPAKFRR